MDNINLAVYQPAYCLLCDTRKHLSQNGIANRSETELKYLLLLAKECRQLLTLIGE